MTESQGGGGDGSRGGPNLGGPIVPDLVLPPTRPSASRLAAVSAPAAAAPAGASAPKLDLGQLGDDFGMKLERSGVQSLRPGNVAASLAPPQQVSIDVSDGDGFGDMEIERGGGFSVPPASSARPAPLSSGRPAPLSSQHPGPASGRASLPAGSGLELGARPRASLQPAARRGPSRLERAFGLILTGLAAAGGLAGPLRLLHRPGRRFVALLPHAFDATSAKQSGAFALTALALAIAVGYAGLRARGRSWAMLGSAAMLLVAALAMVTVTLVATDETPTPPDGALVIPYVMPLAIGLLGLGLVGRGPRLFVDRGSGRLGGPLVALLGGALVFAALELTPIASLLPH